MGENSIFYRDLAYIFVAALLGGLLARKLDQLKSSCRAVSQIATTAGCFSFRSTEIA
jgi:hypothetical protein